MSVSIARLLKYIKGNTGPQTTRWVPDLVWISIIISWIMNEQSVKIFSVMTQPEQ